MTFDPIPVTLYEPNDYGNCFACGAWPKAWQHLDLTNAKGAWNLTRGLSCIKVGITDTRFIRHTDLDGNVANMASIPLGMIRNANDPWLDGFSNPIGPHGTEVASLAAAMTDNNQGIASLGNQIKVEYYNYNYNGILEAAIAGCKVVNCSWLSTYELAGSFNGGSGFDQILIDSVYNMGVTIVAAAGNGFNPFLGGIQDNTSFFYPASYNNVISVTSVGSSNPIGDMVNPGNWKDCHQQFFFPIGSPDYFRNSLTHQHNDRVDISAPGYYLEMLGNYNNTKLDGGTSLATPQVSATAALLYSLNPNFTPLQITNFLKLGSANIANISSNSLWAGKIGSGRLDAGAALNLASNSACMPAFTQVTYSNNRGDVIEPEDFFNHSSITLSTSTAPVAGQTVYWEFRHRKALDLGVSVVTKTGNTVSLNFGKGGDFKLEDSYNVPLACQNIIEIYVRQGNISNCCVSPFFIKTVGSAFCAARTYVKSTALKPAMSIGEETKLKVFPSPANEYINVSLGNIDIAPFKSEYKIFDSKGQVIKTGILSSIMNRIDISNLAKGMYFIRTSMGTANFIKQ